MKKGKEGKWIHILQRVSLKLKTELNIKNIIIKRTENTAEAFLLLIYDLNSVRYLRLILITKSGKSRASSFNLGL